MKARKLYLATLGLAIILALTGCSPIVEETTQSLSIYATFYPIYALSAMIIQEIPDLELHCLVQPQDGCLRDYEMSDWDLYLLNSSANAVIAGGCGLEGFETALQTLSEENFSLAEVLYGQELFRTGEEKGDESSHFDGANPHLYMSIDGAMQIVENIAASFSVMDTRYAEQYNENCEAAIELLNALKDEIQEQTSVCQGKKVAVMNEALFYVARDYRMEIVASIVRESATNLYDEELENCLNTLQASGAKIVFIEKQAPKTLVDALKTAGFAVAQLDVLSTHREAEGFQGYFDAQRANARAAAEACSQGQNSWEDAN